MVKAGIYKTKLPCRIASETHTKALKLIITTAALGFDRHILVISWRRAPKPNMSITTIDTSVRALAYDSKTLAQLIVLRR